MNKIKSILDSRGIAEMMPCDAVLNKMGIRSNTWTRWVANKKDPNIDQLPIVADFLNCRIVDLIDVEVKECESTPHQLV